MKRVPSHTRVAHGCRFPSEPRGPPLSKWFDSPRGRFVPATWSPTRLEAFVLKDDDVRCDRRRRNDACMKLAEFIANGKNEHLTLPKQRTKMFGLVYIRVIGKSSKFNFRMNKFIALIIMNEHCIAQIILWMWNLTPHKKVLPMCCLATLVFWGNLK